MRSNDVDVVSGGRNPRLSSHPVPNLMSVVDVDVDCAGAIVNADSVYHVHLSNINEQLSTAQIDAIKYYWMNTFGKKVIATVTLFNVGNRDDILDMRTDITNTLKFIKDFSAADYNYSVYKSVSISNKCSVSTAFCAGSTFRHHGRMKSGLYLMFDYNDTVKEIKSDAGGVYRPKEVGSENTSSKN